MMIDTQETTKTRDRFLHCPVCATALKLTHQFLNPNQGRTIRLFKCEKCGERIWDE
jgi:transcription initiation factor IIE alpha subunit